MGLVWHSHTGNKLEMCQYDTDAPAQGHPYPHAGYFAKNEVETRGPPATGRSPEWHSHCRYADVMQHFSNPVIATNEKIIIEAVLNLKNIHGMPINWVWSIEQTLNGSQRWFTIGKILAIFDLRVTPMLPIKIRVNWPFGSGEEAKNRFSRWLPWRPSWISDWRDFSYFWSTSHPNVSYEVWSQLAFRCRRRS